MKILFINSVVDFGSTGRIVRTLANGLKSEGHDVSLVYGRFSASSEEDTFFIGNKLESMFHVAMTRLLGRHGLHSNRATKRLIDHIEEYKPDVVHIHNIHGYFVNVKRVFEYLSKHPNIRVLWTLHDAWSISGSSAYFDYHGCKEWNDGCVVCNSTRDYPEALLIKRQRKNFQWKKNLFTNMNNLTLITPSGWLKTLMLDSFMRDKPIHVVYNGIDTNKFKPSVKSKHNKKIILGVASIWEQRKGLEDFVLLDQELNDEYQIVLLGLTKKQINALPKSIIGIERTKNIEELQKLYSDAYVFVNPTYEDNYPTTNLESLCCHTPVLAYDTGGNKEAAPYPYVQIVEKGDVLGLASAIKSGTLDVDFSDFDTSNYSMEHFYAKMHPLYFSESNKKGFL